MNNILMTTLVLFAAPLAPAQPAPAPPAPSPAPAGQISGIVMEHRSGTPDVVVALFDHETGLPISASTRRPIFNEKPKEKDNEKANGKQNGQQKPANIEEKLDVLIAITDAQGRFVFSNLPPGRYRVVAQKWTGPYKGFLEVQGSVIHLFGSAENIKNTSTSASSAPPARAIVLTPPGPGVLQLDLGMGNNETFLLLSAAPPEFDPILGFRALGRNYLKNIMGMNRMPGGRTIVIGLPLAPVHAFYFAADNSPGFASQVLHPSLLALAPRVPFVAGWSDARHDPPPGLKKIMKIIEQNNLDPALLLGMKTKDGKPDRDALLAQPLDRRVTLPDGSTHRLGDLLAADAYRRLQQYRKKIEEGKR